MRLDDLPDALLGKPYIIVLGESHLDMGDEAGLWAFATYHSPHLSSGEARRVLAGIVEKWEAESAEADED